MKCPECDADAAANDLNAVRLEPDLAALGCETCHGALLSLVSYRLWAETRAAQRDAVAGSVEPTPPAEEVEALLCPRCQRIMTKYRYTLDTGHRLDLCAHCDEVWLQGNEWAYLREHGVQHSLSSVFTQPWQRKLQDERTRGSLYRDWDTKLGIELHREVKELAEWIEKHPQRDQILRYLNDPQRYSLE